MKKLGPWLVGAALLAAATIVLVLIVNASEQRTHAEAWAACIEANIPELTNPDPDTYASLAVRAAKTCEHHTEDVLRSYLH